MKINFSKFKKVGDSQKIAVLRHEDGHELRIAKHVLPSPMRKELDALKIHHFKDGGDVPENDNPDETFSQRVQDGGYLVGQDLHSAAQMAHQGLEDAVGGLGVLARPVVDFAKGFGGALTGKKPEHSVVDDMPEPTTAPPEFVNASSEEPSDDLSIGQPPQQIGLGGPRVAPQTDELQQPAADQNQTSPSRIQDPYQQYQQGTNQILGGISGEAAAQGELGKQQAAILNKYQGMQQAQIKSVNDQWQQLLEHRKQLTDYLATHDVDPNQYFHQMGTGQKVRTAIGLILSGFGSGLAHTQNMAENFLHNQVENDLRAQFADLGKHETLLSANLADFGNLRDATTMTRIQMNDMLNNELSKATALAQDPLARARSDQLMGKINQQTAFMTQQLAWSRGALSGANGSDPSKQLLALKMAGVMKPEEVTAANKELANYNEVKNMTQQYIANFNDIRGMTGTGVLSPNKYEAAVKLLAGRIEKIGEGRYNEQAAENIARSMFPKKLTDVSPATLDFKLNQGVNFLLNMAQTPTMDMYGIGKRGLIPESAPLRGQ